jgi:hypothetical protein
MRADTDAGISHRGNRGADSVRRSVVHDDHVTDGRRHLFDHGPDRRRGPVRGKDGRDDRDAIGRAAEWPALLRAASLHFAEMISHRWDRAEVKRGEENAGGFEDRNAYHLPRMSGGTDSTARVAGPAAYWK